MTIGVEIKNGIFETFDAAEKRGQRVLTPIQLLDGARRGRILTDEFRYRYQLILKEMMLRSVIKAYRNEDNKPVGFERLKRN